MIQILFESPASFSASFPEFDALLTLAVLVVAVATVLMTPVGTFCEVEVVAGTAFLSNLLQQASVVEVEQKVLAFASEEKPF